MCGLLRAIKSAQAVGASEAHVVLLKPTRERIHLAAAAAAAVPGELVDLCSNTEVQQWHTQNHSMWDTATPCTC